MTPRTLSEARVLLEESFPHLNDYWKTRWTSLLEGKEEQAKQRAERAAEKRAEEALSLRDAALRDLTEVRDGLDDLAKEGKEGRITSQQYLSRMEKLKTKQLAAEEQLDRADVIAEDVERIESDPIAWFSDLQERTPRLKQEVPW